MYIRKKYSKNTNKTAVQICSTQRIGTKVQQKVVRHVGNAQNENELPRLLELAEFIKLSIENEHNQSMFSDEYLVETITQARRKSMESTEGTEEAKVKIKNLREESRIITGIQELYGKVYEEIGFNKIFGKRHQASMKNLFHTVMARIADPLSKRASVEKLSSEYGVHLKLQSVYEMMDQLDEDKIEKIRYITATTIQGMMKEKVDVLFYDCTTLYFESFTEDGFKTLGYSKDHKFNQSQVLLSLIVGREGLPIGYEVYPGSQYEGITVIDAIESIQKRYEINRVILVADSGMVNAKNMAELDKRGIHYILGARIKNMTDKIKKEILTIERNEEQSVSIKEIAVSSKRRLIVSYKPERARKDKHDRDKWVEKLKKKLIKSKNPKSLLSNFGYKSILAVSEGSNLSIDEEKLNKLEQWDGLHGIITNDELITPEEVMSQYALLWQIEACFRVSKHDLRIRPIYHWSERRIRAHIAICFMALVCVRYFCYRVKVQYKSVSAEEIRRELKRVQVSVVKDIETEKKYCIPSNSSTLAKKLYHIVGLKLNDIPFNLK